ncbi:hypothetical protein [Thalassotalea litorea]|uniref:hypothetical protein n=1 Tax=Thalassotalea litorea TaxID=2020715 RepID=UPI0037359581
MRKTHWVDNVSFYETLVKAKKLASCRDTTRHLGREPNGSDVPRPCENYFDVKN